MGIIAAISNGARALAEYFGWAKARSDLNNSPEMQLAEKKKKEARENDAIAKKVRDGSDDDLRDDFAP